MVEEKHIFFLKYIVKTKKNVNKKLFLFGKYKSILYFLLHYIYRRWMTKRGENRNNKYLFSIVQKIKNNMWQPTTLVLFFLC
jgi:hypothetical protein